MKNNLLYKLGKFLLKQSGIDAVGMTQRELLSLFTSLSKSVTQETAYTNVDIVYACVTTIAERIAEVPLYIYERKKDGSEIVYDEPYQILSKPNPVMTIQDLIEQTIGWYCLRGCAYWWIPKEKGKRDAIWLLPSISVTPQQSDTYPPSAYEYNTQTGIKVIPRKDLIIFQGWSPLSQLQSVSPSEVALSPSTIINKSDTMMANFFDKAAQKRGIFTSPEPLGDVEFERCLSRFRKQYAGVDKAYEIGLLDGNWDFKEIGVKPAETEIINLSKQSRERICGAFKVPPALIGILEHANYANMDAQLMVFWEFNGLPKLSRFERIIDNFFLPRYAKYGKDRYCSFDRSTIPILQKMETERWQTMLQMIDKGVKKINEIREMMDDPAVSWGDQWWAPLMNIPINDDFAPKRPSLESESAIRILLNKKETEEPEIKRAFSSRRRLTNEERKIFWKRFDYNLRNKEQAYKETIQKKFKEQKKRVLRNWELHTRENIPKEALVSVMLNAIKDLVETFEPFDLEMEVEFFRDALRPLYYAFARDGGQQVFTDLNIPRDFQLSTEVMSWISRNVGKQMRLIHAATKSEIREVIRRGIENGESIPQITERIAQVYGRAADYRSERIARTETLGANNFGTIDGYEKSGVVKAKEWLATQDERTRDAHYAADGQVVNLDESFDIGGEKADYPGDPQLSAGNRINCRCTTLAVLKEEE